MSNNKTFPELVDSHAHLDFSDFDRDREEVIQRAVNKGLKLIINIGVDLDSSQKSVQLAEKYPPVYAAVGIHPHDAGKAPRDFLQRLKKLAQHPKVVALGEMGLDFYRDRSPRSLQKEVFRQQLRLAREMDLPVIIHDRNAHEDLLTILKEERLPARGGVMHCFSGDPALARKFLQMGFFISIAGPVTYTKNNMLKQVAAMVPAQRLLLETDAPFLTPGPLRGKRNEPSYVAFTAETVAALRGTGVERIGRTCLKNVRQLFSIE